MSNFYIPNHLPTYNKYNVSHCGNDIIEVRIRALNVMRKYLNSDSPPTNTMIALNREKMLRIIQLSVIDNESFKAITDCITHLTTVLENKNEYNAIETDYLYGLVIDLKLLLESAQYAAVITSDIC